MSEWREGYFNRFDLRAGDRVEITEGGSIYPSGLYTIVMHPSGVPCVDIGQHREDLRNGHSCKWRVVGREHKLTGLAKFLKEHGA